MSDLIKGRVYENKDGRIVRLLAFVSGTNDVYLVDCCTREMKYENIETLRSYTEIDEDVMLAKTIGHVPHISTLSRKEQKVCRDRYNLIAPLLFDIELPETNDKINNTAKQYRITPRSIRKYLSTYCAYGRIEALLPHNKDFKYDCKPKFRFVPYEDALNQEPNYAVLIQDKLNVSINSKAVYANLLFESFSRKILAITTTVDRDSVGAVKQVFYNCLESQGTLPNRLNITVKKPTYNSNIRNLACIGVDVRYSYVNKLDIKEVDKVIKLINIKCKGIHSLDLINNEINRIIRDYNNQVEAWGLSHNYVYIDIKHIFKDSFIRATKKVLDELFNNPYKTYFDEDN